MRFKYTIPALTAALACRAWAGFTNVVHLDGDYDATQPLQDGTVYVVDRQLSFRGAYDGKSGLAVASNATVVILLKYDVPLYAYGDGADGDGPGGAGILLPESSTLVITGRGLVNAIGGSGSGGGETGYAPRTVSDIYINDDYCRAGQGGNGGGGGGGAGAGIGGAGGAGGIGGAAKPTSRVAREHEGFNHNGYDGVTGSAGGAGGNCGTVCLLGKARMHVQRGSGGSGGGTLNRTDVLSWGVTKKWTFEYNYSVGGGGMGGAGAGGAPAAAGFGGGGGGGGGGGSGGSGGWACVWSGEPAQPMGGYGYGGKSTDGQRDGANGWSGPSYPNAPTSDGSHNYSQYSQYPNDTWGGRRGEGGAAGATGTGGKLYMWSTASFSDADDFAPGGGVETNSAAPGAVLYKINFNAGESGEVMSKDVTLGAELGFAAAEIPRIFGKTFQGWYSGAGGTGVKWFNADGSYANAPGMYETVGDTTLYAKWSDIQNFNPEDYRLDAAGIEIGSGTITIPVAIRKPANLDYALDFVKVYASESLPVQKDEPARYLRVETIGDRKVLVIRREIASDSMFYLIDVGD